MPCMHPLLISLNYSVHLVAMSSNLARLTGQQHASLLRILVIIQAAICAHECNMSAHECTYMQGFNARHEYNEKE